MARTVDQLTAGITPVDTFKLRDGRVIVVVALDVTYLRMIQFMKSVSESGPSSPRKRKKRGLPRTNPRHLLMQLVKPNDSRVEVTGTLDVSAPLDAPASMSLHLQDVQEVPVGSRLELTIVAAV